MFTLGPDASNHCPWYQSPYQLHQSGKVSDIWKFLLFELQTGDIIGKLKRIQDAKRKEASMRIELGIPLAGPKC